VKRIHRLLYREGLNRTQALERLQADPDAGTEEFRRMLEFAQTSERGLARGARG
jgi:UDP-N-acetylglucosamine acyltransferase